MVQKKIAFTSGKGGVGKTTIAANIGILLGKSGRRVLMVDADIGTGCLDTFIGETGKPITLQEALVGEAEIKDCVYEMEGLENVRFVPAGMSVENYRKSNLERLPLLIADLEGEADFMLIDCPPGIEKGMITAAACANEVILVVEPETSSATNALKSKIMVESIGLSATGVIVNKRTGDGKELKSKEISTMLETPILGEIRYDKEMKKAGLTKKPIVLSNPGSEPAKDILSVTKAILGKAVTIQKTQTKKKGPLSWLSKYIVWKK